MITLDQNKALEIVLGGNVTTNHLQWSASYDVRFIAKTGMLGTSTIPINHTVETVENVSVNGLTNNTTDVEVVPVPTVDDPVNTYTHLLRAMSVYNADTATATVTVKVNDGTDTILIRVSLASGSHLEYTEDYGWRVYDSAGAAPAAGSGTFVPYTDATQDVDLGTYDLIAGDLYAQKSTGNATVHIDAANATDQKSVLFQTGGSNRWRIRVDGSGDDIAIRRYDNSGTFIDAPIQIDRTSGDVSVNQLILLNVTTAERNALTPTAGMKVFDTDLDCECVYTGTFWRYQITKYLSGDVTNSTNVQASITGLSFSLEANAVYRVSGVYQFGCNNTGGTAFFATFPTSPTSYFIHVVGRDTGVAVPNFTGFNSTVGTQTAVLNRLNSAFGQAYVEGLITNGANAGTFQPQFASGVNTQTSTIYARGTYLLIERIG